MKFNQAVHSISQNIFWKGRHRAQSLVLTLKLPLNISVPDNFESHRVNEEF